MKNKVLFGVTLFLSFFMLISFTAFAVNDFLTVGTSYFWFFVYGCPFIFAILFAFLSFRFNSEISSRLRYIPFIINILTVTVGIGLFLFNRNNPDFGFLRIYKDYSMAANLVENGKLPINNEGFAALPDDLSHTSLAGYAYVTRDAGVTTIYFLDDAETFDGYSWGYLYRSDDSEPPRIKYDKTSENQSRKSCAIWRAIIPPTPKWYYCEAHQQWVFPEDLHKRK